MTRLKSDAEPLLSQRVFFTVSLVRLFWPFLGWLYPHGGMFTHHLTAEMIGLTSLKVHIVTDSSAIES